MNDNEKTLRAPDGTAIVGALLTGRAILKMWPSVGSVGKPELMTQTLISELIEPDAEINLMRNTLALDLRNGQPTYVDANGRAWMHKHLIAPGQETYSSELCASMSIEAMIGRLHEMTWLAAEVAQKIGSTGAKCVPMKTWVRLASKSLASAFDQAQKAGEKIALDIAKEKSNGA